MTDHITLTTGHMTAAVTWPAGTSTTAALTAATSLPGGWNPAPGPISVPQVSIAAGPPRATAHSNRVRLYLPAAAASSAALAYLTYTALERTRQEQGMATIHATALHGPGGGGLLLLGSKGAGKTSTALALAARGWTHAGDDLAVISHQTGDLRLWPGKPTAALRRPHRPLDPKPVIPLAPFITGPVPLVRVVRLAIHPSAASALRGATPFTANERLRLHEALARYISGLPTPLTGTIGAPYGTVWPLDTPGCARWRTRLITALERSRFEYLTAPAPEAAADLLTRTENA